MCSVPIPAGPRWLLMKRDRGGASGSSVGGGGGGPPLLEVRQVLEPLPRLEVAGVGIAVVTDGASCSGQRGSVSPGLHLLEVTQLPPQEQQLREQRCRLALISAGFLSEDEGHGQ